MFHIGGIVQMKSKSDLEVFVDWSHEKGIDFKGIEIRSAGEGAGNGVFAIANFRHEERFISLPEEMMIIAGRVADMPRYKEIIRNKDARPTPFELLTLFFCLEDPNTSEWGPYLKMLPKSFDTPAALGKRYDPAEVPSTVRGFYTLQLKELDTVWERIQQLTDGVVSYDQFLWAWHVVNTRCIYVENCPHPLLDTSQGDTIAVIPFVDMLNHDPNAQGFAFYDKVKKCYCVRATRCVSEGDEIFVCYGGHDNCRLWIEYGFRMSDNINGKVQIPPELFLALARKVGVDVSPEHEKALEEAGQPNTIYASDEGPSWSLQTNMKILLMNKSAVSKWKDVVYDDSERRHSSSSEDNDDEKKEKKTKNVEMEILAKMLEELIIVISSKKDKVNDDLKWTWSEQINNVRAVIKAIE